MSGYCIIRRELAVDCLETDAVFRRVAFQVMKRDLRSIGWLAPRFCKLPL